VTVIIIQKQDPGQTGMKDVDMMMTFSKICSSIARACLVPHTIGENYNLILASASPGLI